LTAAGKRISASQLAVFIQILERLQPLRVDRLLANSGDPALR
jgi:hypothetical protein